MINQRQNEIAEIVGHVEEQRKLERYRERREHMVDQAGVLTRAKWWLTGVPVDDRDDVDAAESATQNTSDESETVRLLRRYLRDQWKDTTAVHLFDALGIAVTREFRVPSGLDTDALNELATSIGITTAIQSKYGAFVCYRQLFEARE